jgi:hypothetical protein
MTDYWALRRSLGPSRAQRAVGIHGIRFEARSSFTGKGEEIDDKSLSNKPKGDECLERSVAGGCRSAWKSAAGAQAGESRGIDRMQLSDPVRRKG